MTHQTIQKRSHGDSSGAAVRLRPSRCSAFFVGVPADAEASSREARERFTAGYIRCMHDVHTFVSTCPGVDQTFAAELLHHLMQSMPLNDEQRQRGVPAALGGPRSTRPPCVGGSAARGSPAPSSYDHSYSDLDETESEQNHFSSLGEAESQDLRFSSGASSNPPWRPW